MYQHILIATDGSELAQKGIVQGLELAKVINSKVTVITVSQPYPLQAAASFDAWSDVQTKNAESALAKAQAAAEERGLTIDTHHDANDSAAEAIVEAARSLGCNLIVMASHGRRGVSRLLLGSQTNEVVSHSPIPVLVVR